MNSSSKVEKNLDLIKVSMGAVVAVIVSMLLILLFAFLIKCFDLSDNYIAPVNIAIKIISLSVGIFMVTKDGQHGMARGGIIGAVYIVLSYIVFSLLLGSFSFSMANIWDICFGLIAGGILGIIFVNIRK